MKTIRSLNIPNTTTNHSKVADTVATHMIEKCLDADEIKELAIAHLASTYASAKLTIGDLASLVSDTPADVGCRIPQPEEALYYGVYHNHEYYFSTRAKHPAYNSLEVKEEVR